jgi:hypothetical protein
VQKILENLSLVYFEGIPKLRKDFLLPERDVSELINSLIMIKHIIVIELERKHKDVASAFESVRLQTIHISEAYFHESNENKIIVMRMPDLLNDIKILRNKITRLKEVTKPFQQKYTQKLTQMKNITNAVHEIVTLWSKREGSYYEFGDQKQIVDKLNFLIEITTI